MYRTYLPNWLFWGVIVLTVGVLQILRWMFSNWATYNSGIAFSLSLPTNTIFVTSGVLLLVMLIWFHTHRRKTNLWAVAFGLIVGGGASNLLERWFFQGQVADYIHLGNWSSLNLADVVILVGIGLALSEIIRYEKS